MFSLESGAVQDRQLNSSCDGVLSMEPGGVLDISTDLENAAISGLLFEDIFSGNTNYLMNF